MVVALIVAGGKSTRMGRNKLKLNIGGQSVLNRSIMAFDQNENVDKIIVACSDSELIENIKTTKPCEIVEAGSERQYTVRNGLALVNDDDIVLIHDGARPFVSNDVINRCIESVKECGSGVACYPIYDSMKRADSDMNILEAIDRDKVFAMQTPQAFLGKLIKDAHKQDDFGTDDAYLVQKLGKKVKLCMGSKENIKLTTVEDIPKMKLRIGQGYDVHKLVEDRKLILCGVEVPFEKGLLGHSDADVATHALMDALLGAMGGYDIGKLFPDTDPKYKGADSVGLLKEVASLMREKGFSIVNCDVTIVAQKPKLLPYIDQMRNNLANALNINAYDINVKATTTEHLGFEGRMEGISSNAVVLLQGENCGEN